jgi:hypothetical protein
VNIKFLGNLDAILLSHKLFMGAARVKEVGPALNRDRSRSRGARISKGDYCAPALLGKAHLTESLA